MFNCSIEQSSFVKVTIFLRFTSLFFRGFSLVFVVAADGEKERFLLLDLLLLVIFFQHKLISRFCQ